MNTLEVINYKIYTFHQKCGPVTNELIASWKAVEDVPFDFMGKRAYIAKKADAQFERVDGSFGNIIYSKEKVNQ